MYRKRVGFKKNGLNGVILLIFLNFTFKSE